MSRAPSICAHPGCPNTATNRGRCTTHQRKAWVNRSPSSRALASNTAHRATRRRLLTRADGHCEHCGTATTTLQLHHPEPIAKGGAVVQAAALMLCHDCHHAAHHP